MFLHYNHKIVNSNIIGWIDCTNYFEDKYIVIFYSSKGSEKVDDPEATNIITKLAPSLLEGERAEYTKYAWTLHNLIGHPMMQIFELLKLNKLSSWAHDVTLPKPKT